MSSTAFSLYARLLPFARPYLGRLIAGILAGVAVGGTLYGMLRVSPNLIAPFEQKAAVGTPGEEDAASGPAASKGYSGLRMVRDLAARHGVPVEKADGGITWQFMLLTLLLAPILVILRALADYANQYYMRWVGARVVMDLRNAVFERLMEQSLRFFGKSDVGQLISRMTNDSGVIESVIATTVSDMVRAPIEILSAVIFVLVFSAEEGMLKLVSLLFLVFPLCVLPIVILGKYVRRYTQRALERISEVVSRMHESFTGIRAVKAFNTERREHGRFVSESLRYFRAVVRALRAELLMTPLMEAVGILLAGGLFVICYARGVKLHQIVPVFFAAVLVYKPLKQLARINANVQRGCAALERILHLLNADARLKEAERPVAVREFADRITFERVDFSYNGGNGFLLEDISFEIRKGGVIAVVGETGSGKTTIANLLARFYDPTGGRILLDGIDLRDIEIASLRRMVGVVTQETILFNDTIANNIAYGCEGAGMEAIVEAAKKANAHDFILGEVGGYDRVVGEKGFVLSGGERQRIAIARAILRNPPILILDEATSALDTVTERLVQEAISRVMKDRTVFAIAHRLSTVRHANLILLVAGGRIAERGTHEELLAAGGAYRKLCDMQVLDGAGGATQ